MIFNVVLEAKSIQLKEININAKSVKGKLIKFVGLVIRKGFQLPHKLCAFSAI